MDFFKNYDGKLLTQVMCLGTRKKLIAKIMPISYIEKNRDKVTDIFFLIFFEDYQRDDYHEVHIA